MSHETLYANILAWLNAQEDIRAGILLGSRARSDGAVDALSDYDLILYTNDLARYEVRGDWIDSVSEVWLWVIGRWRSGYPEHLTIFAEGQKVDFAFAPVDHLREIVATGDLDAIEARGYQILVDKDGLAARLPPPTYQPPIMPVPTAEQFTTLCEQCFYGVYQIAKALVRTDLWFTRRPDNFIKDSLIRLLEWRARAVYGAQIETWYSGRKLHQWLDAETYAELRAIFAPFEQAAMWSAFDAQTVLFRKLAREVAELYGFTYPTDLDANISGFVARLHR